ncbi:MAG: AMED_5909 family protein [Pseudonocardiaceae bacterium]
MSVDKAAKPQPPRTLMQAHDALVRVRPSSDAPLKDWHAFYERSVALYLEIAEIDRGHHHEALYWAERELEKVKEVVVRLRAEKSQ